MKSQEFKLKAVQNISMVDQVSDEIFGAILCNS